MGKRWALCALIVLFGAVAYADTGGSMGGGSWGGGGGGGYSGGGYSGGGYSSHSSSSDWSSHSSSGGWSSSSGSGGDIPPGIAFMMLIGFVAIWVIGVAVKSSMSSNDDSYASYIAPWAPLDTVDVSVLRIAVDGRARKFIQTELKQIAQTTDTATPQG